jgi:uncharacterized protein involved in exopolysaccharide biosynthesis
MELDSALKSSNNSISELQKKLITLREQLKSIATNDNNFVQPESGGFVSDAKSKLLALQLNEQDLLKKYTENNRLVVNVRKEIDLVKNYINELELEARKKAKVGNPLYLKSETELNSYLARHASIKSQLSAVDGEINALNTTELDLENLKREKLLNEKNYQVYTDRAEESHLLDEMNRLKLANISVIQSASPPVVPVNPNRIKIVLQGVLCGMVLALGCAFLSEWASQSFSTPEKVERLLGVPVLISIPYCEK